MKHDPTALPRPLWQTFLIFLWPMMLSNVLQSLSGTINTIFLGQMIGVQALAAATVFFPVTFFFIALVIGMGAGSSVLIGQAWGAGEVDKVKTVAGTALTVTTLTGVVIAVFGGFFARSIMVAMHTPPEILDEATKYARTILVGMPAFFIFILATSMLRGVGDTVTPLWALVVSTIVGLVLTPALIQGWAGLPKLGVTSAAVAGIASQIAGLAWMGWRMLVRKNPLAPDAALFAHLRPKVDILRKVMRIGLPTGVQMVTVAISELVLIGLVNRHGSDVTAAYGAVNQVIAYAQFPAMSVAISASILGAQAIGAGHADRLPVVMRAGQMINLCLTGGGVILVYLFSKPIIDAFITERETADLTRHLLHIVLWSMVFFGGSGVFGGIMRASGTVLAPMLMTIFAIVAIELPVAVLLERQIGVDGIWWAYPAAFCSMFVMQGSYYGLVWRKKRVERLI
jgi:putative MATE family efflux protein